MIFMNRFQFFQKRGNLQLAGILQSITICQALLISLDTDFIIQYKI